MNTGPHCASRIYEVVVRHEHLSAGEVEMRVAWSTAVLGPTEPADHLLLCLADQDHGLPTGALGSILEWARPVLLGLALGEGHDLEALSLCEALDRVNHTLLSTAEDPRGGVVATVEHPAHEQALGL